MFYLWEYTRSTCFHAQCDWDKVCVYKKGTGYLSFLPHCSLYVRCLNLTFHGWEFLHAIKWEHMPCVFSIPKHYPAVKYCFATFQSQQTKSREPPCVFKTFPCLQAGECHGGEQPLPPSSANSVRNMPVTSPACLGEEPTDTDLTPGKSMGKLRVVKLNTPEKLSIQHTRNGQCWWKTQVGLLLCLRKYSTTEKFVCSISRATSGKNCLEAVAQKEILDFHIKQRGEKKADCSMPWFLCPSGEGLLRQPGWMPCLCWAAETQGLWKGHMEEVRSSGKCQCPAELGNMAPRKTKVQGHFHSCAPSKGLAQHSSAFPQRPWPGYAFDLLYEAEAVLASAPSKN